MLKDEGTTSKEEAKKAGDTKSKKKAPTDKDNLKSDESEESN